MTNTGKVMTKYVVRDAWGDYSAIFDSFDEAVDKYNFLRLHYSRGVDDSFIKYCIEKLFSDNVWRKIT